MADVAYLGAIVVGFALCVVAIRAVARRVTP